jgi:hypothetical protein
MVARDGVEPPTPAFSDVKQQALLATYKSWETAEVLGNTCRPTQLLPRIADRPPLPRHATWHASFRAWAANCVHFQLAMLAYNLNCWLMLFNREEKVQADDLKHTTLVTVRLRFRSVAAKIWRHAGQVGISYSDQYAERGLFQRLMDWLRKITTGPAGFRPVLATTLSG